MTGLNNRFHLQSLTWHARTSEQWTTISKPSLSRIAAATQGIYVQVLLKPEEAGVRLRKTKHII